MTTERPVPTPDEVALWTVEERATVARALDRNGPHRSFPERPPRFRWLILVITTFGAVVLVPWIAFLSVSLPERHRVGTWDVAWVGFDVLLLISFTASAWAVWKRRLISVAFLGASAFALLIDAWFDMTLSWGTREQRSSLLTGLLVELPVAIVLIVTVGVILRRSGTTVAHLRGTEPHRSAFAQPMPMVPLDATATATDVPAPATDAPTPDAQPAAPDHPEAPHPSPLP